MAHDIERLTRLVNLVAEKLAEADAETGKFDSSDYSAWRKRHDAAEGKVKQFLADTEGAAFSERPPHDHAVRMAGIRSTSTSGFTGALGNWRRAALAAIGAAEG